MRVVVITLVAGRHGHLRVQRCGLRTGSVRPDRHVVVAMADPQVHAGLDDDDPPVQVVQVGRDDGRPPLARARNAGAAAAIAAGADLLVFLDVDCVPGSRMLERYASRAADDDEPRLLCGPVAYLPPAPPGGYDLGRLADAGVPHPARPVPSDGDTVRGGDPRLFWSLSFAVRPAAWRLIGGFCERYRGYGAEDTDLGQLAAAAGVRLDWIGGAWAYHQFHASQDPPVHHLRDVLRNAAIFHERWGWWPMSGWLAGFERLGLASFDSTTQRWQATGRDGDAAGGWSARDSIPATPGNTINDG